MNTVQTFFVLLALFSITTSNGQRITTIQLDGVQYFVSRMNPYSPELNYFLAYQYCRSLGLQLVSFETREKADSVTQYLSNAGYSKYDFWTSGNKLGTDMFLWMSSGLPFNATFDYMKKNNVGGSGSAGTGVGGNPLPSEVLSGSTAPQRTARDGGETGAGDGCVILKAPHFEWTNEDCTAIKDFICEQTRCYYYNYGSIPVSSAQGLLSMSKPSKSFAPSTTISKGAKESVEESSPLPSEESVSSETMASQEADNEQHTEINDEHYTSTEISN